MNLRENVRAVLQYEPFDHMPVIHFGYWQETLEKWREEGHLTAREIENYYDGSPSDRLIARKLGFDYGWQPIVGVNTTLFPGFEARIVERRPDGTRIVFNPDGVLMMEKEGIVSIPVEVGHTLVDRESWEKAYLPRLQWEEARVDIAALHALAAGDADRTEPLGLHCGSLLGNIRTWIGVEGLSSLSADDPELYEEIVRTVGELSCQGVERALEAYDGFDYLHFWEDICFKNGPLVIPSVFRELAGPYYRRITTLAREHGIGLVSLDCDGLIDTLLPIWLENGVNVMFPIEVGTWNASIAPWRERYGRTVRGVGGMDKRVFAADYAAVDREIERLKPLMAMGGYIPCPDHRIPPDAKYENVQYYCDRMQSLRL